MAEAKMGTVVFDFPVAIRHVIEGRRITKLDWKNPNIFLYLQDGFLRIHKEDGTSPPLSVSEGDMVGRDWTVLEEN